MSETPPETPDPVLVPAAGDVVGYPVHDLYSDPPRPRVQLVVVVESYRPTLADGTAGPDRVRALPIGYADECMDAPVSELV